MITYQEWVSRILKVVVNQLAIEADEDFEPDKCELLDLSLDVWDFTRRMKHNLEQENAINGWKGPNRLVNHMEFES